MIETVVEIKYLPLKTGVDLDTGEDRSVWEATLEFLGKQPGVKSLFWGRQIEHPDILQLVVDWESLDAHNAFSAVHEHRTFKDNMQIRLLSGTPRSFHTTLPDVELSDNPFRAPVTECISGYFAATYPAAEYEVQFTKFRDLVAKTPNVPSLAINAGWAIEGQEHEVLGDGVVGKVRTTFIGWPSLETHGDFTKTEAFGEMVPLLRDGPQGATLWHVAFKQFK